MISRSPQSTYKVSSKQSNCSGDTDFEGVLLCMDVAANLVMRHKKLTYKIWLKRPSCFWEKQALISFVNYLDPRSK